ncbi:peptide receptor gpcr [Plakobranchus ocellatus]|uniref:Peptide receptor gpcr n=1 Tax=Plakobranchus ocellatus TaxID=259542 RepID=A0AAV4ARA1_9GAST|nr:peptide receptor gpcr [Plakobranchus ocellatus]
MLNTLVGLSSSQRMKTGKVRSGNFMMESTNFNMSSRPMNTRRLARGILVNLGQIIIWSMFGIGIFGVIGNILIILVYMRLGVSETTNASYLALAISDLLTVLSVIWIAICETPLINLLFNRLLIVTDLQEFKQITGIRPHFAFSKTTALITAWISTERCFCVVFPMKVKFIITRTVNTIVIVMIFIVSCGPVMVSYMSVWSEWREDPLGNQDGLFLFISGAGERDEPQQIFVKILYDVVYPVFSWIVVIVNTTVLIIKLKQSANWRKQNLNLLTTSAAQRTTSARTNRVTKTAVVVASIFIVCTLPISLTFLAWDYLPRLSSTGKFRNIASLGATLVFYLSELNSSVNIIVFTIMGARFRSALLQMVCRK